MMTDERMAEIEAYFAASAAGRRVPTREDVLALIAEVRRLREQTAVTIHVPVLRMPAGALSLDVDSSYSKDWAAQKRFQCPVTWAEHLPDEPAPDYTVEG